MFVRRRRQVNDGGHTILVPLEMQMAKMQEDMVVVEAPGLGLPVLFLPFLEPHNQEKGHRVTNKPQEEVIGMAKRRSAKARPTR